MTSAATREACPANLVRAGGIPCRCCNRILLYLYIIDLCTAFDYQAASVTGVDIDPKLVAQAEKLLALRASRARPPTKHSGFLVDFFPISAVLSHGYRIEPEREDLHKAKSVAATTIWPHVSFHTADWVATDNRESTASYDVILALSVIKWIHLKHLDEGLLAFFAKCSSSLSPGGYLVIELQDWDSYEKAVRPNAAPHFKPNLAKLQYRPETSFDKLLLDEKLHLHATTDALPRQIKIYRKVC